ncbi:hypothetical protein C0J52_14536 [Blattella germanica]|nr:hypothetical protein C0J52_14536 [Blattella germanica]
MNLRENMPDPGGGKDKLVKVEKPELVPPDGGWGWVVVFAFALSNILISLCPSYTEPSNDTERLDCTREDKVKVIAVPILQSFGLLFRGRFEQLDISATDAAVIINVNSSFGMILAIGFNLLSTSFNLAINSYFKERRGKAVGFATTAMGLGPVLMPLLISKLMAIYGVPGTALILGGLSLHSLVGALLLQPIKWHMKPKKLSPKELEAEEQEEEEEKVNDNGKLCSNFAISAKAASRRSIRRSTSQVDDPSSKQQPDWWASAASLNTVNLGSSLKIFDEKYYQPLKEVDENNEKSVSNKKQQPEEDDKTVTTISVRNGNGVGNKELNGNVYDKEEKEKEKEKEKQEKEKEEEEEKKKEQTFWQRIGSSIVSFFDLTLLLDPIYVNLMVGMSLAICAEFNFSLLTPFILNDRGFNTDNTAIIMSVIASLDIVFRFIVPFFSDHYKIEARNMYSFALCLLVSSRTALIFSESFNAVLIVAIALGVAKGVRTVYMTIVIPCYVPIERLAAASGMQMVVNGIFLMVFGPFMGVIRDASGSYNLCIAFINTLTVITLTMWGLEILILKIRRSRRGEN